MKSPAYVYGVTSVYRRLLDECRGPTPEEEAYLESLFSRCGFTDGYFCGKTDRSMLGVRTEENKQTGREAEEAPPLARVPLTVAATVRAGEPMTLTIRSPYGAATVTGDVPLVAEKAPMTAADYEKNLCKFGATPFEATSVTVDCDEGLMVPVSRLNALRRAAVEKLTKPDRPAPAPIPPLPRAERGATPQRLRMASYREAAQISPVAKKTFDAIFLPVDHYDPVANGVELPPVIYDTERETVLDLLAAARGKGAKYALVSNVGHVAMVRELGFIPVGSHRFNVFNAENARVLAPYLDHLILSAELTVRQAKDFPAEYGLTVYGRMPLMYMHRCIIKDVPGGCRACATTLTDRKGATMPVLGGFGHRCTIYNSVPTYMADRREVLTDRALHFYLFTTESREECDRIIRAYQDGTPTRMPIRRIP